MIPTKHIKPWGIEVKKELLSRGMMQSELADAIGVSTAYVNSIINGTRISERGARLISDYLNISYDYYGG